MIPGCSGALHLEGEQTEVKVIRMSTHFFYFDFLPGANLGTASLVEPPARQRLSRRDGGDNRARDQGPAGHEELLPVAALAVHPHLPPDPGRLHLPQLLHLPARLHPPVPQHLLQRVRSLACGGRLQPSSSVLAGGCTKVYIKIYFAQREQTATPRLRTAPRSVMPLLLTLVFLALGIACLTVLSTSYKRGDGVSKIIYFRSVNIFHCD